MKIALSLGSSTFEFDGTTAEFDEHALSILNRFLAGDASLATRDTGRPAPGNKTRPIGKMTAKAVATVFAANTGPDLVYAASAYLAAVEDSDSFSRQMLLDAMKSAVGFYKPSYSGNLTKYVDSLCKKSILIEISSGTYTVKASALADMIAKLSYE